MRVVLLTNTYAPYRAPVWAALAKRTERLDVVLIREQDSSRNWTKVGDEGGYALHALDTVGGFIPQLDAGLYLGGRISRLLQELKPTHLIVAGYAAPQFVTAIRWARKRGVRIVQWYESHALSSRFRMGPIRWLRESLLKRADAWAVPGIMARDYLVSMGIPAERITLAPNSVDVRIYATATNGCLDRSGPARFLYVGRFIKLKGLCMLMRGFACLQANTAKLRLVGYGPLERNLRSLSSDMPNVEFHTATHSPFETAQHYAWADVVAMPSIREVWGLVINEALAAGCYALSSSVAGVTPDLIENAPLDVGRSIDPHAHIESRAREMANCVDRISDIRQRRAAIQQWGLKFSPEVTANGLWLAACSA